MQPAARRTLAAVALAGLAAAFWLLAPAPRSAPTTTEAPPPPGPDLPATADTPARWSPEEVFRRAFWRQPTADDRILEAVREEAPSPDSAGTQSWRWAIAVHPSPELLAVLRSPETFGLLPAASPRPWTETPAWFPPAATPGMEVLQAPTGRFTVLYRVADNLLYATDAGGGFAPPAR